MNQAHWHLILSHFPLTGSIFSTLLLVCGLLFKNDGLKKTALLIFVLTALLAAPVYFTGEGAEDVLESIGQKNHYFIHEHEEIAEKAFFLCQTIAILSIASLLTWKKKKKLSMILTMLVLITALINSILMIKVGNAGGQIRHTEIRDANTLENDSASEKHSD